MVWIITNYRERHLKQAGKILGKIQKGPGDVFWAAILAGRPRKLLGFRYEEQNAKALLERHLIST